MSTVYVGLSGGVDSSVAAALLRNQGYRVVGVYMQNWTQPVGGIDCPWQRDLTDAKAVAAALGLPFKVFDFQTQYKQRVVDYMVAEYAAGRTPNPDVMCNQEIKFKLFLEAALADGADLIATGHYARVKDGQLLKAADTGKDQTYFLSRVSRLALERTLFPIGELTKSQVRQLAAELDLSTAAKPDSQGICFVGEVGIKDFLRQYLPTEPGPVVSQGMEIGRHDGAAIYTIGQRHGLAIGGGRPYFVTGKDMETNTVYVTDDPDDLDLQGDEFEIEAAHWFSQPPQPGRVYQARLRHRGDLIDAELEPLEGAVWRVKLARRERAVTPGQAAVIYDGQRVLGGGFVRAKVRAVL